MTGSPQGPFAGRACQRWQLGGQVPVPRVRLPPALPPRLPPLFPPPCLLELPSARFRSAPSPLSPALDARTIGCGAHVPSFVAAPPYLLTPLSIVTNPGSRLPPRNAHCAALLPPARPARAVQAPAPRHSRGYTRCSHAQRSAAVPSSQGFGLGAPGGGGAHKSCRRTNQRPARSSRGTHGSGSKARVQGRHRGRGGRGEEGGGCSAHGGWAVTWQRKKGEKAGPGASQRWLAMKGPSKEGVQRSSLKRCEPVSGAKMLTRSRSARKRYDGCWFSDCVQGLGTRRVNGGPGKLGT